MLRGKCFRLRVDKSARIPLEMLLNDRASQANATEDVLVSLPVVEVISLNCQDEGGD